MKLGHASLICLAAIAVQLVGLAVAWPVFDVRQFGAVGDGVVRICK